MVIYGKIKNKIYVFKISILNFQYVEMGKNTNRLFVYTIHLGSGFEIGSDLGLGCAVYNILVSLPST